jgi:hypothetical protein
MTTYTEFQQTNGPKKGANFQLPTTTDSDLENQQILIWRISDKSRVCRDELDQSLLFSIARLLVGIQEGTVEFLNLRGASECLCQTIARLLEGVGLQVFRRMQP